jgi:hypothetical protein
MGTDDTPITGETKVAALLDQHPELEETLIAMAPPFAKLRNPLLRRSVAKVASLRQAAKVGRLPVHEMVNALRAAVGQPPIESPEEEEEERYFTAKPDWFRDDLITDAITEGVDTPAERMAITTVLKRCGQLTDGQILELRTTFLPVPGIDLMRAKGFRTWTVEDTPGQVRTFFTPPATVGTGS